MPAREPYSLEQAEDDVAEQRGLTDKLGEIVQTGDVQTVTLEATGAVTATGGTAALPSAILTDTWHSLGALGAHYTVTLGRYRLTTDNCVELDIKVVGDGLQATSVTFANVLPAAYRPATQHDSLPMGTPRQVTAGDIWPRLLVDTAGNVTVNASAVGNTFATCVRVPLD